MQGYLVTENEYFLMWNSRYDTPEIFALSTDQRTIQRLYPPLTNPNWQIIFKDVSLFGSPHGHMGDKYDSVHSIPK